MILSFRQLDAIYTINRPTGAIVWKLGGIHTSKSLRVLNDPEGSYPLGGQHDPRLLPDGTISIYRQLHGSGTGRPRVVRYQIDEEAKTARLVESFADPTATASPCCGSARLLPSGDWLVSWGGLKFTGGLQLQGSERLQAPVSGWIQLPGVPRTASRAHRPATALGDERDEPLGAAPRVM